MDQQNQNQKYLKCSQIANLLNISNAAAYRLVRDGQLPSVRFNKTVRVKTEDFDEFLRRNSSNIQTVVHPQN